MNNSLLDIVKRIIAENGENILSEPQRLKPLFSDYAKNEQKEERIAFGQCIEIGAYNELKNSHDVDERTRKKSMITDHLHEKTGKNKSYYIDALNLLETAMLSSRKSDILPLQTKVLQNPTTNKPKRLSNRTVFFGIAGVFGACVGSIIGGNLAAELSTIANWTVWQTMLSVGITIGLLVSQSIYLKKELFTKLFAKSLLIGVTIGIATGIAAGLIVGFGEGGHVYRIFAWGITGLGIGLVTTFFISNYPKKRAMVAGLLGGFIGYGLSVLIGPYIGGFAGVVIGDMVLGLSIGLNVSIIEEAFREAWLTIIWGPNETRTIAIGAKPIVFGSSSDADIHLQKDKEPLFRATVQIENSQIVMYDKKTNQRQILHDKEFIDFGNVSFTVNTKK